MLASAVAAERGYDVLLLEKNPFTGKKLNITGKGRCNVTNDCSVQETLDNIPTGSKFMYSALNSFTPQDTVALFERLDVPLNVERGNRVFPVSNRAGDITEALRRYMKTSGVTVRQCEVKGILTDDGRITGVTAGDETVECGTAVLCTGGMSYPRTGSTGDGYAFAEALGHTVVEPKPSLVPLEDASGLCARMQGLSLRNIKINVYNDKNKLVYTDFGEMLFTHFGVSGPVVLSASAHMRDFSKERYYITIDLKPALDHQKLDSRILRDFAKYSNKDFKNSLNDLVNKTMIPIIIELSGIPADTKVNSITRQQRHDLLELLKNFRIDISGPRPISEAIITSGGVDVREVNPTTMESKLVKGLYFAGEILNVDAYTGGFNLQIAWSTAYAAGTHIEI